MVRIRHLAWWASGPVLIGVALATATPAAAAVAAPIGVDSCVGTVQGAPGQPVALKPAAVLQPITDALTPLDPLGVLRWQLDATWTKLRPIPIGAVSADPGSISGKAIGHSVVSRLSSVPAMSPVLALLSQPVGAALTDMCGVATKPGPQKWSPAPKPAAGPEGSRASVPRTIVTTGSPQSFGGTALASSGHDATHGSGVSGGVAPEGVAYQMGGGTGLPGLGVPPESVITLSNQQPPLYSLPPMPSASALPQATAANPQQSQRLGATRTGTGQLLNAREVISNKRRLVAAFAVLLLALVLSQFARSWALRSPGRHTGPGADVQAPR
jgi:hypothetical protein